MKPVMRSFTLLVTCFFTLLCRNESAPSAPIAQVSDLETKDLVTFFLPQSVRDVAPLAQDHFLKLLPYCTVRHQMKPRTVFIDRGDMIVAPISALVTRLNFVHVVYFREDIIAWNGSLLFGIKESPLLATREGYHLGIQSNATGYELTFQDGSHQFAQQLDPEKDSAHWLVDGERRLYVYHYAFPEGFGEPAP